MLFDPQEVLDRSVGIAAVHTGGLVECSYFRFDGVHHLPGGGSKGLAVQVCDFLAHDPIRHRVDVGADDVTSQAIGFQQRRATAHKGIADDEGAQVVAAEKAIRQRLSIGELGQQQGAKERAWPTGEPLVYADDRAIMLLDLLLPLGQLGHKGHVKVFLDHPSPTDENSGSVPARRSHWPLVLFTMRLDSGELPGLLYHTPLTWGKNIGRRPAISGQPVRP